MAISASTRNQNNTFRKISPKSLFEDGRSVSTSTLTFNQGDFICFDTTNKCLKLVAATGDAATILGQARQAITNGVVNGPYQGLATPGAASAFAGPVYGDESLCVAKTGDNFTPGCKVYLADGLDSQTVSVTDPGDGNYVGVYQGVAIASAAAGQQVPILIGARYPAATGADLKF